MVINHVDNITKYAEYLGTHPAELQALFNDMLIGVTSFFREPDTFTILKEKLFPELLKSLTRKGGVRGLCLQKTRASPLPMVALGARRENSAHLPADGTRSQGIGVQARAPFPSCAMGTERLHGAKRRI